MSQKSVVKNLVDSLGGSSDDLESSNNSNRKRNKGSRRRPTNRNNKSKSRSKSARRKKNKSKSGTPSYKAKDVENMVKLDEQNDFEEGDDQILSDDEPAFTQQVTKENSPVRKIEDIGVLANCDGMCFFLVSCFFLLVVFSC